MRHYYVRGMHEYICVRAYVCTYGSFVHVEWESNECHSLFGSLVSDDGAVRVSAELLVQEVVQDWTAELRHGGDMGFLMLPTFQGNLSPPSGFLSLFFLLFLYLGHTQLCSGLREFRTIWDTGDRTQVSPVQGQYPPQCTIFLVLACP